MLMVIENYNNLISQIISMEQVSGKYAKKNCYWSFCNMLRLISKAKIKQRFIIKAINFDNVTR